MGNSALKFLGWLLASHFLFSDQVTQTPETIFSLESDHCQLSSEVCNGMRLGTTTIGAGYVNNDGGRRIELSSAYTPVSMIESARLWNHGVNPQAMNPALALHGGASAAIDRLMNRPERLNMAWLMMRQAAVFGARTVGRQVLGEAVKNVATALANEVNDGTKSVDKNTEEKAGESSRTGGPDGGDEDPEKKETKIEQGKSQAPKEGTPDSIYEQIGDDGNVKSRTFFDKNGKSFARQDFGGKGHPVPGSGGERVLPHEHVLESNAAGQRIAKETVKRVAEGYTKAPSL